MKKIIIVCLSFILLTCKQSTSSETTVGSFAIYTLKDTTVNAGAAIQQSIEDMVLADTAFLNVADIQSYLWSSQSFDLTTSMNVKWENFKWRTGKTGGVPFIVTVGKERIYLGTFWWGYSSSMPPACAVIQVISPTPYKITLANGAVEKRDDPRIYSSLKNSGVLVE